MDFNPLINIASNSTRGPIPTNEGEKEINWQSLQQEPERTNNSTDSFARGISLGTGMMIPWQSSLSYAPVIPAKTENSSSTRVPLPLTEVSSNELKKSLKQEPEKTDNSTYSFIAINSFSSEFRHEVGATTGMHIGTLETRGFTLP